jgi:prepilin-type processing-associated H-X9-DG protein
MYCPKCGTQNPDVALVCSSCSAVLSGVSTQTQMSNAKTSGLAIASLVLAILSPFTCFITAIPAIIMGIVVLVKISQSRGQLKGTGLAITAIVLPVILVPVVAMLMGILMPALARTRQIAFRTVCGQNMSGLGRAMLIYANDYDDQFPTQTKWCDLLMKYTEMPREGFRCHGALEGPCNYAMNKNLENFSKGDAPPEMVALFETHPGWNQVGGPEMLTTDNHQGEGCNVLFADNHVEFVKTKDLKKLKW